MTALSFQASFLFPAIVTSRNNNNGAEVPIPLRFAVSISVGNVGRTMRRKATVLFTTVVTC